MSVESNNGTASKNWVEPEIRELDVTKTFALPNRGADVLGNPYIDCQKS